MTKLIPLSRAAATAAAAAGACLLALAVPGRRAPRGHGHAKASGENTPLNLSSGSTARSHHELGWREHRAHDRGPGDRDRGDLGAVLDPAPGQVRP